MIHLTLAMLDLVLSYLRIMGDFTSLDLTCIAALLICLVLSRVYWNLKSELVTLRQPAVYIVQRSDLIYLNIRMVLSIATYHKFLPYLGVTK